MSDKIEIKRGKKLDLFCWKCHKSETNFGCSRCERSFHNKCISLNKSIKELGRNWVCNECANAVTDPTCPLDSLQLQQMILSSLKMISKSADYYFNSDNCFADKRIKVNPNPIVNPINLKKIEDKVNAFEYKAFRQMTSDFKWFLHNCIVGQLESGLLENAKFLLSKVKSEQKDFEECVHCFINYYKTSKTQYYSWFSKPCLQMHPIVWAKVRGHPFWPSKVIKENPTSDSVLVRFFGTHQKSWVKERDCYLISEGIPKALTGKGLQMEQLLNSAIEEMNYNIKYLNKEYPNWFRFSPKLTPFSIKNMVTNNNLKKSKTDSKVVTNSKDTHLLNRPLGWKPKARKTFPTPTNSSGHILEIKPIEISMNSNDNKKPKVNQNIEIIEFNSRRLPIKRELSPSIQSSDKRNKTDVNTVSDNNFDNFQYFSQQKNMIESTPNSEIKPKEEISNNRKHEFIEQNATKTDPESDATKTLKCLQLKVKNLEKMIEIKDNNYKKQIMEMQKKSDLEIQQMRRSLEIDKQKAVIEERNKQIAINSHNINEMKTSFEIKTNQMIAKHKLEIKSLEDKYNRELTDCKTKIWCFSCLKEAQLFCCSHTYYCSNECQLKHWENHKQICTQQK